MTHQPGVYVPLRALFLVLVNIGKISLFFHDEVDSMILRSRLIYSAHVSVELYKCFIMESYTCT